MESTKESKNLPVIVEDSLEKDNWLKNSPEACAAIELGIEQSKAGQGVEMSFLEYADLNLEE